MLTSYKIKINQASLGYTLTSTVTLRTLTTLYFPQIQPYVITIWPVTPIITFLTYEFMKDFKFIWPYQILVTEKSKL